MREVTEVAVGVLIDKEGRFLMASRQPPNPYEVGWVSPVVKLVPGHAVTVYLRR